MLINTASQHRWPQRRVSCCMSVKEVLTVLHHGCLVMDRARSEASHRPVRYSSAQGQQEVKATGAECTSRACVGSTGVRVAHR